MNKNVNIEYLTTESNRCLNCKNARCKDSCPISTDIPKIIELFKRVFHKSTAAILILMYVCLSGCNPRQVINQIFTGLT